MKPRFFGPFERLVLTPPDLAKPQKTRVDVPQDEGPGSHRKVAVLAAIGLVIGVSWPVLAGKHLGPNVPGMKKDADDDVHAAGSGTANAGTTPSALATGIALSKVASADESETPAPPATKQTVTVDGGTIVTCWHGKEKLDGARCGTLKLDRTFVPNLRQLSSCPSALGLTGALSLTFDIDFDKKAIHVKKGKKSAGPAADGGNPKSAPPTGAAGASADVPSRAELPTTTVSGILACVADYVRDLQAEKIPHDHGRYLVDFALHFRAHTEAPTAKVDEEAPVAEPAGDDVATIAWDSALMRDEPRTGKTVARLVRGTRVKILGSRKDWFEVKMGNRQGWLYRSALGR